MRIIVAESVGQRVALSSELGKRIRDLYGEAWKHERLELDFTGIRNVSPSFLSQAIMPLLFECNRDEIENRIAFISPPDSFDAVWKAVLDAIEARKSET